MGVHMLHVPLQSDHGENGCSFVYFTGSLKELSVCQVTPKPPFTHSYELSIIPLTSTTYALIVRH